MIFAIRKSASVSLTISFKYFVVVVVFKEPSSDRTRTNKTHKHNDNTLEAPFHGDTIYHSVFTHLYYTWTAPPVLFGLLPPTAYVLIRTHVRTHKHGRILNRCFRWLDSVRCHQKWKKKLTHQTMRRKRAHLFRGQHGSNHATGPTA